ncbi:CCA tRNA nucleotidyltransferase [Phragmitibacter flavus]|uniref:CCA tRNA nucleotidyltransferase n=1 Tax=Phragmitibacter flavus TaxID=2576071 RepID=A0A5R8KBD4_9BACT|nr:CCA tRNA nucleotidyltransferase [Phragmitibacter flavus]TLD68859.1 CCA tRNA nucleotidyltransferase [Phragmitibacter flavus]
MSRDQKSARDLKLPPCPLPRPGDEVIWYTDSVPHRGKLEGHGTKGRPHVRSELQHSFVLDSFDVVRLQDTAHRRGPAWEHLPDGGRIFCATASEQQLFGVLLARPVPPGPRYAELITEIWSRGFEIFVVGGTVRDVLAGKETHDVDLVTTMPLNSASRLLKAMYRSDPQISDKNGYVRLGGVPRLGDPFIDLKMFSLAAPGTENAIFGADFCSDVGHRDFSCNAIYYDPINAVLIDPSGRGIEDAKESRLCLVCDQASRRPKQRAQIVIRFLKFKMRGFEATVETIETITKDYLPDLAAMDGSERLRYLKAQVINKCAPGDRQAKLEQFRICMIEFGAEREWVKFFQPLVKDILS